MADTPPDPSPVDVIMGMTLDYPVVCRLHLATALGIAELREEGSKTVEELTSSTRVHGKTHDWLLHRQVAQGAYAARECTQQECGESLGTASLQLTEMMMATRARELR